VTGLCGQRPLNTILATLAAARLRRADAGGPGMTSERDLEAARRDSAGNDGLRLAFETVEATLLAENWFFQRCREKLADVAPLADFPTVSGSNGHDFLLHFTQFLFFLKALECRDADRIAAFIDGHNARIEEQLADPGFAKSPSEFRKAIFRPERKAKVIGTIRALGEPVFAIYEYGHLMINEISPKTTEKLIEDLRHGGLLVRREDPRIDADSKRVLIASTGFLERTYEMSLLMQRRLIARSVSPAEHSRISQEV